MDKLYIVGGAEGWLKYPRCSNHLVCKHSTKLELVITSIQEIRSLKKTISSLHEWIRFKALEYISCKKTLQNIKGEGRVQLLAWEQDLYHGNVARAWNRYKMRKFFDEPAQEDESIQDDACAQVPCDAAGCLVWIMCDYCGQIVHAECGKPVAA